MKVFLDTNVLASALTTRGLCAELFEVVLQSHELLTSDTVLHELERILPGKLGQSEEVTEGFINLLPTHALLVSPERPFPPLPDPDDEPIVASALAGNANVFVTGDKALLELQDVEHLPIVSPRNFWEILAGRS
ncbi:MAG TPA: putative toxin-antitoxin system toxin component, PIN family [Gammaproteobacteria bacterium]|nr:putative toxin-antitoxin system toxin component, PIN family [Gammaproteobacteria bacterium]